MNKNTIVIITVSIVVMLGFLLGAYTLTSSDSSQPQNGEQYEELQTVAENDHTKWSDKNEIILVEYSDLQCPACAQYHTTLLSALDNDPEVTENITFIYRHFPLDRSHPNAREAAYAAEAAGKQGRFFSMHDMLFERQNEWEDSSNPKELFIEYAAELKLDEKQFTADMNSDEVHAKVQEDFLSGQSVNVQGTPTFYLNGTKLNNPVSAEDFKQQLMSAVDRE